MWEKNRPEVRKVEEHLAKLGTPSGLRVPERRMLILSRTGAPALAKNNKPRTGVEEGEETPLLKETRSALTLHDRSQIPPTRPHALPQLRPQHRAPQLWLCSWPRPRQPRRRVRRERKRRRWWRRWRSEHLCLCLHPEPSFPIFVHAAHMPPWEHGWCTMHCGERRERHALTPGLHARPRYSVVYTLRYSR